MELDNSPGAPNLSSPSKDSTRCSSIRSSPQSSPRSSGLRRAGQKAQQVSVDGAVKNGQIIF